MICGECGGEAVEEVDGLFVCRSIECPDYLCCVEDNALERVAADEYPTLAAIAAAEGCRVEVLRQAVVNLKVPIKDSRIHRGDLGGTVLEARRLYVGSVESA